MKQNEDRRTTKDRRETNDKQSEKFIKHFISDEQENRDEKKRRKSNPDNE